VTTPSFPSLIIKISGVLQCHRRIELVVFFGAMESAARFVTSAEHELRMVRPVTAAMALLWFAISPDMSRDSDLDGLEKLEKSSKCS
jgi:hypothetical protein